MTTLQDGPLKGELVKNESLVGLSEVVISQLTAQRLAEVRGDPCGAKRYACVVYRKFLNGNWYFSHYTSSPIEEDHVTVE